MWNTLQPEIVAHFPRHSVNGARNGGIALVQPASLASAQWTKRIDDLESFRQYRHDWDGQGAEAPTPDLLESAVGLATVLREHQIDPPCCVVAGVNGTVVLEWQWEDGAYLEIEVTEPYRADAYLMVPGHPTEHWIFQ